MEGNDIAAYCFTVYRHGLYALFNVIRIENINFVYGITELTGKVEITKILRHARIDGQAFILWLDAQNILGDIHKGPCRGAGQPAVLGLAVEFGIPAGYHL